MKAINDYIIRYINMGDRVSFEYKNKKNENKSIQNEIVSRIDVENECIYILLSNKEYSYLFSNITKIQVHINSGTKDAFKQYYQFIAQSVMEESLEETYEEEAEEDKHLDNRNRKKHEETIQMLEGLDKEHLKSALNSCFEPQIEEENKEYPMAIFYQANKSQKEAINKAFHNKISIVQGPPGTGKTQTILNLILNLLLCGNKVLVISKNNSAIDNVYEKLLKIEEFPTLYIRLGNRKDHINPLLETILKDGYINHLRSEYQKLRKNEQYEDLDIYTTYYYKTKHLEAQIEELTKLQNELFEIKNTIRKLEYKYKIYQYNYTYSFQKEITEKKLNRIVKKIAYWKKAEEKYQKREFKNRVIKKILDVIYKIRFFRIKGLDFSNMIWKLEYQYAKGKEQILERDLQKQDIEELKHENEQVYEKYVKASQKGLMSKLKEFSKEPSFEYCLELLQKFIDNNKDNKIDKINFRQVNEILTNLYPIVLTTIDSVSSNLRGINSYDYVVIDEASQADIYNAIPALVKADNLIVVGDLKQLEPIISEDKKVLDKEYFGADKDIEKIPYCYSTNSLLSFIQTINKFNETLLREHYRCKYHIINFCNRKYYDNELTIYSDDMSYDCLCYTSLSKKDRMIKVIDNSYINPREIEEICEDIKQREEESKENLDIGIITPFRVQSEFMKNALEEYQEAIGTIHKFQGREHDIIYFSPVLCKEKKSISHYQKSENIFTKELINVAVSRAKKQIHVVTDEELFLEYKGEMYDLIRYILLNGKEIKSKVFGIFDGLYSQIDEFKKTYHEEDSIAEYKVHQYIRKLLKENKQYYSEMHFRLADIVGSDSYYEHFPEHRRFAKKSEIDFVIFSRTTDSAVFAIEIDGKHHENPEQIERDKKKEQILKYHEVPLWRIDGQSVIQEHKFEERFKLLLENIPIPENIRQKLERHEWKYH